MIVILLLLHMFKFIFLCYKLSELYVCIYIYKMNIDDDFILKKNEDALFKMNDETMHNCKKEQATSEYF